MRNRKNDLAQTEGETRMNTMASKADFDTLKKEATKLERQLEDRVGRYQQLAQRITNSTAGPGGSSNSYGNAEGNNGSLLLEMGSIDSSGNGNASIKSLLDNESKLQKEINRLLNTFQDHITIQMSKAASKTQHQLQIKRYREILFDLTADFNKTQSNVSRKRDTIDLFSGRSSTMGEENGEDDGMSHLLRERSHIDGSINAAFSVLNQAGAVHSDLRQQRNSLVGIGGKMVSIAGNIPGVNKLVDAIRSKRGRDDQIVSIVIAFCICFTLWYLLS
mmetsp:Transcript_25495/g.31342  ORF Transcript_25495/g.31342 Transcript_25495/m.31342 type:complete len:276 (-) Transcript_25495:386-1213(-)